MEHAENAAPRRADLVYRSIPGMVRQQAIRFAASDAVIDGERRVTYPQLAEDMWRSARALMALGLQPGDRVAVWGPNTYEWMVAALGLQAAGGVLVPINTRFKGPEAAYVLGKSKAKILFTEAGFLGVDFLGMLEPLAADLPALSTTILLRGERPGSLDWNQFLARGDEVDQAQAERRLDAVGADDPCDVIFTSGTTGDPKGVVLTHGQSLRAYEAFNEGFGLAAGDRYLVVNPFFHCFGYKCGWMLCLLVGATVVPHLVFEPKEVLTRVGGDRITVLAGPPTMFADLLETAAGGDYDLSTLRYAFTAAAAIPESLINRLFDEWSLAVGSGYGLTESTAIVSVTHPGDDAHLIATTVGVAVEGIEVIVSNGKGEVPRGESGEVLVRGFNVTSGYLDDPVATAAAIDPEGWLHTGDIGQMDERGYLRITDRMKDMFIVGGFNVSPVEVENLLLGDDRLAQAAVVGVPDERQGEVAAAFVIPRAGVVVSPDEVMAWARHSMANYKVPRYVQVVDKLPVNASGKVLKSQLRPLARTLARQSSARPAGA